MWPNKRKKSEKSKINVRSGWQRDASERDQGSGGTLVILNVLLYTKFFFNLFADQRPLDPARFY